MRTRRTGRGGGGFDEDMESRKRTWSTGKKRRTG